MLEATPARLMTATEFWAFAALPENADKRLELIDGVVVEAPQATQLHSVVVGRMGYFLNDYVIPRKQGYITGPNARYTISLHNAYTPSVAYISKARHPNLSGNEFPLTPDLAVEVHLLDEYATKTQIQIQRYLENGTQLVWSFSEKSEYLHVSWRDTAGKIVGLTKHLSDTLDGGTVLPGFSVRVGDIFPS